MQTTDFYFSFMVILEILTQLSRQILRKRGKQRKKIPPGYPQANWKIPEFHLMLNPGILYPGIFQESKSRDFLVPGFFDPGISRDIPGPGYPVDIPILYKCELTILKTQKATRLKFRIEILTQLKNRTQMKSVRLTNAF